MGHTCSGQDTVSGLWVIHVVTKIQYLDNGSYMSCPRYSIGVMGNTCSGVSPVQIAYDLSYVHRKVHLFLLGKNDA